VRGYYYGSEVLAGVYGGANATGREVTKVDVSWEYVEYSRLTLVSGVKCIGDEVLRCAHLRCLEDDHPLSTGTVEINEVGMRDEVYWLVGAKQRALGFSPGQ